jgi:hypothetical protein
MYKLIKYIENKIKIRKIQNKFPYNPLEQISTMDLTKFIVVHYCIIENSYKSNLGVFIYRNT